jgi:hypothetical protein
VGLFNNRKIRLSESVGWGVSSSVGEDGDKHRVWWCCSF